MNDKIKDVCVRSLKTFWQAALAYFVTAISTQFAGVDVFDADTFKNIGISLIVGALAAGLSAVWNAILKPLVDKVTKK